MHQNLSNLIWKPGKTSRLHGFLEHSLCYEEDGTEAGTPVRTIKGRGGFSPPICREIFRDCKGEM